ncbi:MULTISPECIES: cytochrome c oxidase accessory protein CcoG [Deefgea]|uniref:Cytochrome c oxidase accessory protein CcoG n=1 Tax=Deefgea chitinilytica TaxID=570276 RepID=A0ABS2C8V4_9NEIS|nr:MULTISPECIES: cytochrome c oxidase accessory protein CcoG [Deefgea]MBM5570573.1 cytochrome c oxidase accessory protein CcoG [Deefgea chitinilytica]MBM9887802.1 cytochrome c oxidase accessory protein CcoG [Deefgea sp. CFH1-16]
MSKKLKDIPVNVINVKDDGELEEVMLYAAHKKIYPRWITGFWNNWRIFFVIATQLFFYCVPWLEINDRQALLFDLANRKFYIFSLVFLPQDFIYLTALLLLSAFGLFAWTTIGGRLWCGYACPQTVYTEIFLWIEKWVEGDRGARIKLDNAPLSARKIRLKATKHAIWVLFALWTGFTFVGFFTPIRELWGNLIVFALSGYEIFWILFYGFATYGNAGWMREQVCKYMCPYARFQSAMFDADTLIISYDKERGENRGSRKKGSDYKADGLGDCIDCSMCVQVCPVGIDIRNGLQYECIGCAACIDACDEIMDKMNYPRGLVRYTTENALEHKYPESDIIKKIKRPRVIMYAVVISIVLTVTISSLLMRQPIKLNIERDRVALVREAEDGNLENTFRLLIQNASEKDHVYLIRVEGLPEVKLIGKDSIELPSTVIDNLSVRVQVPPEHAKAGSHEIRFIVTAKDDPSQTVTEKATFIGK